MGVIKNKNSLLLVTIIVIVAKAIAFLREFVLSYFYGVSNVSDAYNIAYTIPITIIGFIALALNTSYIPQYNRIKGEEGEEEAIKFSNNLSTIVFIISLFTFILLEILATPLVKLFAGGFDADTIALTSKLTRWMSISVVLIAFNRILSAYVQLKNKYYIVTLCEIALYTFSIVGIVLSTICGYTFLSFGVIIGYAIESVVLIVVSLRSGYKIKPFLNLKDPKLRRLLFIVLPVMIGSIASDINKIVDKSIASNYAVGSISVLSYAHKIDEAIVSIFVTSLISLSYPKISSHVRNKDNDALQKQFNNDSEFLLFLLLPIVTGCLVFAYPITKLLFLRGKFTLDDAKNVSLAFFIYVIGMIPTTIRKYYVRIFYSFDDSKTPASNSLIVIAINIGLSILLANFWGIYGVAAGSTISITIGAVLLMIRLRKHVKMKYRPLLFPFLKISSMTCVSIGLAKCLELVLNKYLSTNISMILLIVFSVVCYFGLLFVFRMKHVLSFIKK